MPLFIDATRIEVDGHLFQWVRRNYEGRCGYWLHASFLGGLWTAGQLCPGGGRVTLNWRTLLERTAQALPEEAPVWLRADNAYYKGERVRRCAERGWDYSISVTHDQWLTRIVHRFWFRRDFRVKGGDLVGKWADWELKSATDEHVSDAGSVSLRGG